MRVEPPASRRDPIINSNPDRSVVRLPSPIPSPSDSRRSIIENRNFNNQGKRTPNPNRRQTAVVQPSPRPSTPSKDSLTRRNRIVQRSPLLIDPSRRIFPKTDPARRLPVRRPAPVVSPQEVKQRLRSRTRPSEIRVDSSYRQIQRRIYPWRRREYPSLAYYDRPTISHTQHYIHTYQDRWHRWHQCIITPRFSIGLRYHWGHHYYLQHVYPFYHRKYVFVSLGGCWPLGTVALRYYWYGWYPYEWYGYNPVPYQLEGNSTNYYTYNYYDSDASLASPLISDTQNQILDNGAPPEPQGPADVYFELAVKAFEQGDYRQAEDNLAQAMAQDSKDIVLPFAYAQTLFAQEQYTEACESLREIYARKDWNRDSVYFPRGLYSEDEVLFDQIDRLVDLSQAHPQNTDLQLLLGYQLLGVGELDSAMAPLVQARQDPKNIEIANALIEVLIHIQNAEQ